VHVWFQNSSAISNINFRMLRGSKQSGILKDDFNLFWLRDALADQH
jgi:hypothetical protein